MNMDGAVRITCVLLPIVAGLLFIQTGRSNWGLILFGRFGGSPGQPGTPPLLSQASIGALGHTYYLLNSCNS